MNKTIALVIVILVLLACSFLTRVSDEILESIVIEEMQEELMNDSVINELLLVDLAMPAVKEILTCFSSIGEIVINIG